MHGKTLLIASLTGIIIIAGAAFYILRPGPERVSETTSESSPCPDFHEGEITVGEKHLTVAIAASAEEKTQGLSGCPELPENAGMLFLYEPPAQAAFWMKDMVMPLDIVWIREGKVAGIEAQVPPPSPGTALRDLAQYHSPELIDSVLEIKSGGAEEHGIKVGSKARSRNLD